MASSKAVWGIDLGHRALKAICLRSTGDTVEVVNYAYIEHSKLLSHPDVDRQAIVNDTVKKFLDEHDLTKSNDEIVVSVPGQHTLARFSKLPPVDKKKVPQIVEYEAQQQIPFDMEEVIWDYQVFQDEEAMETEVGIFAMRRDLLREHLHFLSSRNLEPSAVQSSPLALCNALKYEGMTSEDEAICVLDIGAKNTDLVVVEKNSLWSRNIPLGGNNFTEVLQQTFKTSFGKAERLKRQAAKDKYAAQLFKAMRPVFADLTAEIQRSIGFFTSSRRGVKLSKIVAVGGAFHLPGMVKYIQQQLGMEVIRPKAFSKLEVSDAVDPAGFKEHMIDLAVPYGLALQELGLASITSSLLPSEIRKQVIWRKKTPWFYGAAACLAVSALLAWTRNIMDSNAVAAARDGSIQPQFNPVYDEQKDPKRTNPEIDPQANAMIRQGLSGDSALAKAEAAIALGTHVQSVLGELNSRNNEAIEKLKDVAKLEQGKLVWPAVLQLIHDALPNPGQELTEAMADGPEAYRKLIESDPDKYARANRRQVFITSLEADYCDDVMARFQAVTARKDSAIGSGAFGGMEGSSSSGGPQKGFLIRLLLQSPNKGELSFLDDAYLDPLREAQMGDLAYVAQAQVLRRAQVKDGGVGGSRRRPSGGMGGPFGGSLDGGGEVVSVTLIEDPVTGEPINNDWEFETVVAVVLDKKPEAPPDDIGGNDAYDR